MGGAGWSARFGEEPLTDRHSVYAGHQIGEEPVFAYACRAKKKQQHPKNLIEQNTNRDNGEIPILASRFGVRLHHPDPQRYNRIETLAACGGQGSQSRPYQSLMENLTSLMGVGQSVYDCTTSRKAKSLVQGLSVCTLML